MNAKLFVRWIETTKYYHLKNNQLQDIINVKCDAYLISSLCQNQGFLPAYHMNKTSWLSILLDGSVSCEEILKLIDLSYELTK